MLGMYNTRKMVALKRDHLYLLAALQWGIIAPMNLIKVR